MNYKKLGMFLIIGMVVAFSLSIMQTETMAQFVDRLILSELVQVILWCFVGKEK